MVTRSVQSDLSSDSRDGRPGGFLQNGGENGPTHVAYQSLSGKPIDMSKTGSHRATTFIYALIGAEYMCAIMFTINLVPYLVGDLHLGISYASNLTNYYTATGFMLSVLGAFIADAYLGQYRTVLFSSIFMIMGLAVSIVTVSSSSLKPDRCVPTATTPCKSAGSKIMIPTYLGLYLVAMGSGGIKPNISSFGADQYDDASPVEKKKSENFFSNNFVALQAGGVLSLSLMVYLQDQVSRGWGYAVPLMLFVIAIIIFIAGTPRYRHKSPSGSFLVRLIQVFVAAYRNRHAELPKDNTELWEVHNTGGFSIIPGVRKLPHSNKLRILDKAAAIPNNDCPTEDRPDPWRLCTVTQVEETKRILRLVPIWLVTSFVYLFFAQLTGFSVLAASSMNREWGDNFEFPSGSTALFAFGSAVIVVPLYSIFLLPLIRKFTGHPMGISPLQRIGGGIAVAVLACVVSAVVEQKRLDEVRSRGLQTSPIGTFVLPMSIFYLFPQYFLAMVVEFFLVVGQLEFFYGETSDGVRSIGTSFTYSSLALGFYLSTATVDAINSISRNHYGGAWLESDANDGGLKKYWYFLAVLQSIVLVLFMVLAYLYEYNPTTSPVSDSSFTDPKKSSERELREVQTV